MAKKSKIRPTANDGPLIPASQNLPEITIRALILGTILTIVLAAANAYLGLKVGQTVSASIPAAIISMGILRFFRNSNVLESTMVQTMASVGEALIAGVTFILPALIILHAWNGFYYWQTVIIALLGGILGVLFTIPLRRALLLDPNLRYPEGVAIGNVLKASSDKKTDMGALTIGGLVGAIISLCQTGFQFLTDNFYYWVKTSNTVYGFGLGLSPALIAAGYIVGINVAISIFVGVVLGWIVGVPAITWLYGLPLADTAGDIAISMWRQHIRYIGVGTMLVAGLWTLFTLIKPITQSILTSVTSLKDAKKNGNTIALRTERDFPIQYVLSGLLFILIPLFIFISLSIIPSDSDISHTFRIVLAGFGAIYILLGGFIFCSVAAYFAGLIGSTNTPVSGLLVASLCILCMLFFALFSMAGGIEGKELLGVILGVGSTVIISAGIAIANDTMQDLKVGQMLGATPWKQQLMLIIGVITAAFVIPPILDLLYNAYGIGGVFPRPDMDKSQMLAAPQAGLMAAVAQGVYARNLEWSMIILGAIIAVICMFIDQLLKRLGMGRLPVLAVGVGIYLPLDSSVPVIIGGVLSHIIYVRLQNRYPIKKAGNENIITHHKHRGLTLACGIVAGASIMGVLLAIPFALKQSSNALKIMPDNLHYLASLLGLLVTFLLCAWIYRTVMRKDKTI